MNLLSNSILWSILKLFKKNYTDEMQYELKIQ